ncbi:SH3 domain-containing protein [Treponema brennaborense]|uniref:Lipoprotein n=1 Tax=Treponema brennaborense (strain DSM 12168 / CIP 105900 / DD5/3) TaxID=906968 RepID=F4LPI3_TREBD|nr:SH3 domain-containing protein [Treponema brennaborense]AEE15994.1 putative lipoprotein [Treponema brennaborense DSM 12168]
MGKRIFCIVNICIVLTVLCVTGCSKQLGYGVLLWSVPEKNLSDGDIVPVYIKSNISQVYVIGIPGTKEKLEVPLWQITEPASKGKTAKRAARYEEYRHQYARVVLDGLPIRYEPVNTSRQIYRLRKNEVIKVLYKGQGAAVMSGANSMAGDWLRVLTSDGTQGWCFSYNLRLFDIRMSDVPEQNVAAAEKLEDSVLDGVVSQIWYPDSYASMIKSNKIDLTRMKASYRFDPGLSGQVELRVPDLMLVYPYTGVEKTGSNTYQFKDTPISITVRSETYIVVHYTNEKGMPTAYNFVTISEPIEEILSGEQERRQHAYDQLEAFGPRFSSSNYGTLELTGANAFTWSGYKLLQPAVIPKSALGRGTVEFDCFLSNALSLSYDGVLSFKFDNVSEPVRFLYKIEEDGLRLEDAATALIRSNTVMERSSNPVVMFFAK